MNALNKKYIKNHGFFDFKVIGRFCFGTEHIKKHFQQSFGNVIILIYFNLSKREVPECYWKTC